VPELPEVETIARNLQARVAGARIVDATVSRPDVLRRVSKGAFPGRVAGRRIVRCWRRAKTAILDLSDGSRICVQPRFTGALLVETRASPLDADSRRYSTLRFHLSRGMTLHYVDVRRLGTVALLTPDQFAEFDASLGTEPLASEFTAELFSALLRASNQPIKKFIMNQAKVAGVGNIYAAEALWMAGIDPSKPASLVAPESALALHGAIVQVLSAAIAARGTSFRDYRDAEGEPGEFFRNLNAYGRAGQRCRRCGRKLIGTHEIDGRATVFCSGCQR
jgi:formamidopyrimidine-DNA glycosylase